MRQKKIIIPLIIAICAAAIPLLLLFGHVLDKWELAVYDELCRLNIETDETSDLISLILIDTKSLEWGVEYYERYEAITGDELQEDNRDRPDSTYLWPWKRLVYETIIHFLTEGGARVVAFDLDFSSPHNSGDTLSDFSLGGTTLLTNEEGKSFVLHTLNFLASEQPPQEVLTDLQSTCLEGASLAIEGIEKYGQPFNRSDRGFYYGPVLPYGDILADSIEAVDSLEGILRLGAVCAQVDHDAVVRRARVLVKYQDWIYPSLGLAAVIAYLDSKNGPNSVDIKIEDKGISLENKAEQSFNHIPLTPSGDILIHWKDTGLEGSEGEGRFKTYPAYRILLSAMDDTRFVDSMAKDPESFRIDPKEFKDRIVFVGASAIALYDLKATPISKNYPGVKVHAAIAENLLQGDPIYHPSLYLRAVVVLGLTLLAFFCTLYVKRASLKFILTALIILIYVAGVFFLFSSALIWMDTVVPLFGVLAAYMGGLTYNYFTEGHQKREITRMFKHCAPPVVVDQLVEQPGLLSARGKRKEITVFFSDIKGFTSISNTPEMRKNPDQLTDHLNEYLTVMSKAILECGGTLDKYIGDAVVSFFGAPLPMENHAIAGCRAALMCQSRLDRFNEESKSKGLPEFITRIGLFSGEAIVGFVGSELMASYTAIGSVVNFGSRMEGVNKAYGTWILAGESTVEKAGNGVAARFIDLVRVPGIIKGAPPLKAHQVIALQEDLKEADQQMLSLFQKAMLKYSAGEFDAAKRVFERCVEEFKDPPSMVFSERCQKLLEDPPESWDGIWKITSK